MAALTGDQSWLKERNRVYHERRNLILETLQQVGIQVGKSQASMYLWATVPEGYTSAEFAISVRSDLKGQGLGSALLEKLIRYCRGKGTEELTGQVLPDNRPMLALAARHGFAKKRLPGDDVVELRLSL